MSSTSKVYSVLCHGEIVTAEVLDHKARNRISIVGMGTEGEPAVLTPTYLLVQYFMRKYGPDFMERLLTILVEHGERYIRSFVPDDSTLEKDIRFMFDVNARDLKRFPAMLLRAYYGNSTIVNLDLESSMENETVLCRTLLKGKHFDNPDYTMLSIPNSNYVFETMYYRPNELLLNFVSPLGLFGFDGKTNTFDLMRRMPTGGATLKSVLDFIHHSSRAKKKIVFMMCCKMLGPQMMDFEIAENPIEKVHTRTLVQMMTSLRLGDTAEKIFTPKAKRKRRASPSKSKSRSRKKTKVEQQK